MELTDTLSTQVENLQVTNLGSFTQSGTATVPVFTLPVNTANGSYSVTYTVVVKSDATGSVGNSVVVTNNGGDPTPSCPAGAPWFARTPIPKMPTAYSDGPVTAPER